MTSSPSTASTPAAAQNAVAPRPRGPTRAQQLNKIYTLPAPLRTYPLPTLVPHNPLSLFYVIYTWISQTYNQPKSHPETLYQGWFSPETRSVHITDPRSSRALWEQGFYGKGNLSRSEPSWHDREKRRKGAKASQTSEEVTRARRAERQQVKWERARKEREAIDQTLSEERKQTEAPVKQDGVPNTLPVRDNAIDMSSAAVEAMIPTMDTVVSEVEEILSSGQVATEQLSVPAEPIPAVDVTPEPQSEDLDDATTVETVTVIETAPAVGEPAETIAVVEDTTSIVDEALITADVSEDATPVADESTETTAVVTEAAPAADESAETITVIEETIPAVDESVAEAAHDEQSSIELPNDSLLAEEPEQPATDEVKSAPQDTSIEQEVEAAVIEQKSEQPISSIPAIEINVEPLNTKEDVVVDVEHDDHKPESVSNEPSIVDEPEPEMTEVDPLTASTELSEEPTTTAVDEIIAEPEPVVETSLSEVIPETTPEATSEVVSEFVPEVTSEATPEATPEATSEVIPDAAPEVTPEATPEVTSEAIPEAAPEVTPEATPEAITDAISEAVPEAVPEVAAEEPVPTRTYEFNAAPVVATEIVGTVEQAVAPVEEIPEPSPLVKIFMAACEKRGCPIVPQYATQVLEEHDNKLVPAVLAVTRNYDPALMNIVQTAPSPPAEPEVEVETEAKPEVEVEAKNEAEPEVVVEVEVENEAEPEIELATESEVQATTPLSPVTAPVGPLELLALPNSLNDLSDDSTAVESTKSANEFDEHISVIGSHEDSQEDSFVKENATESHLAPTSPLALLALPNSAPGTVYPSFDNKVLEVAEILDNGIATNQSQLITEEIIASTEAVEATETAIDAGEAIQESIEVANDIQDEDVEVAAEVIDVAAGAVDAVQMAIETIVEPTTSSDDAQASIPVDDAQDQDSDIESETIVETEVTQDESRSANFGTPQGDAAIDKATEDQVISKQTTPLARDSIDMAQGAQSGSIEIHTSTEREAAPCSPKSPKTVRFSPNIEETTFIKESAPSPELAAAISNIDDVSAPEYDVAIVDKEHLQLTLEETFFLAYALGVLTVHDPETKQPMTIPELFDACRAASYYPPLDQPISGPDDPFLLNYIVYHHFRSLGWVVRGGTKFSVDFLLYNRGPPFSHAEFAVVVMPSYSDPYWTQDEGLRAAIAEKEKRSWHWLHCINRVNSQVKKTVVLVYVDVPPPAPEPVEDAMGIDKMLKRYKIRELVMKRWLSNRSRD